jgi:hypothetical protein
MTAPLRGGMEGSAQIARECGNSCPGVALIISAQSRAHPGPSGRLAGTARARRRPARSLR